MNGFILPYLGQISKLRLIIADLKKSIDWYKQNNQIMSELLRKNNINYQMKLKMPEFSKKIQQTIQDIDNAKEKTVADEKNSKILNEMLDICFKKAKKVQYSDDFKAFSYSLYCSSELGYRSLRAHFPFPSESCLRKKFSKKVKDLEEELSSIDHVKNLLNKRSELYGNLHHKKIQCTLVIDVFTTTTITPYTKRRYIDGNKSNCFLFLIEQLNKNLKIFPVFLYETENGMADDKTFEFINKIIEYSKTTNFVLKYVSVDGDKNYQGRFVESNNLIDQLIQKKQLKSAFQVIDDNIGFQIADFLHLLKNARSRLLNANIVIRPDMTNDSVQYFELMKDKEVFDLIKDVSSLAKLRDELPKNLFCFQTLFRLIDEKYSFSTFFYFFVYTLWNESIFNVHFGPSTRKYFLKIILEIFIRIKSYYEKCTFDKNVYEKKAIDHPFVTFITKEKIPRILNTLTVLIKEIEESFDDNLGLSRLGSHPIENFIGRIRSLCHMDNRFETVLHNLARYELIVRDFESCYLEFRSRHNSPGGTVVKQMGNDFKCLFDQSFDPSNIVNWIFQYLGFDIFSKDNKLNEFLGMLQNFSIENPYSKVKLP